ncbi:gasdermin-A3-like [Sylvia borin]
MFKKVTKFVINQTDPREELVPVESIAHNEHFRPFYLLIKKRKPKRIFHPDPYYQRTGFTLQDVLLPGEDDKQIEPILEVSSQFTLTQTSSDQADGDVSISVDHASVELQGAASLSNEFSIKVQKKSISQESLEALRRQREINLDHSFIRQLRRTDIELFVVTEILEASEEAVYKESTKADRGFWAKLYATFFAKATRENIQSIVIPKGCTLAFRIIQIHIKDGAWDLGHIPMEVMVIRSLQVLSGKQVVESEIENRCQIFSELSPDLLLTILTTIKAVMRDKNLLQELSQKVSEAFLTPMIYKYRHIQDHTSCPTSHLPCATNLHPKFPHSAHLSALDRQQPLPSDPDISFPCSLQMEEVPEQNGGYELKTESPDLQALFSTLQHSPRDRLLQLAEGITYVLDALHGEPLGLKEGNRGRDDSQSCHSLLPSSHTPPHPQVESTFESHGGERRETPSAPIQGLLLPPSVVTASSQGAAQISALVTSDRTQANGWSCGWDSWLDVRDRFFSQRLLRH